MDKFYVYDSSFRFILVIQFFVWIFQLGVEKVKTLQKVLTWQEEKV